MHEAWGAACFLRWFYMVLVEPSYIQGPEHPPTMRGRVDSTRKARLFGTSLGLKRPPNVFLQELSILLGPHPHTCLPSITETSTRLLSLETCRTSEDPWRITKPANKHAQKSLSLISFGLKCRSSFIASTSPGRVVSFNTWLERFNAADRQSYCAGDCAICGYAPGSRL